MQFNRRGIMAGLGGLAVGGSGLARAQSSSFELKVSHYLPPNHTFQRELVRWGEELDQMSGGRLKLRIYPASQLGPVNRQFDLVRNGVADIAVGLHGATPGRYPMTELVSLPYQSPKDGLNSATMSERLTQLAPKYLAAEHAGMKILWMAVTNPLLFFTAKKPLNTIADFKGLRIRYAGEQFAKIIPALGAVPLPVPPGDTQDALAKGILDGTTFPYEAAQSFDLGTVVKYALEPGVSSASFAVVMRPQTFDGMPADLQALITKTVGVDGARRFGAVFDRAEAAGKDFMLGKGTTVTKLSDADMASVKTTMAPIVEQTLDGLEKQNKPARAFLADYTK